jgi:6-hydroxycyclohex-1-ene-1-carbonyl-CoA dehydrogenase
VTRAWSLGYLDERLDGPWRVTEHAVTAPTPGPVEVVIAVEAVTIDGVDLARARAGSALTPGRAAVGRVIATGEQATALLDRRVLVGPHLPCGECDVCRRGSAVVCPTGAALGATVPGAFADRVAVAARWAVPLEGPLAIAGPAAALLGGAAAHGYAFYARAGVGPREPTVVLGDDAVARCLVEVLVARGAPPVVLVGAGRPGDHDGWHSWLESKGATPVAIPDGASSEAVRELARGALDLRGQGVRPWFVFETGGRASAQSLAIAIAGPGATVVLAAPAATGAPTGAVDLGAALDRELTIISVAGAHPDLLVDVAALAIRGELDLAAAAEIVSPAELATALARPPATTAPTALVVALV